MTLQEKIDKLPLSIPYWDHYGAATYINLTFATVRHNF